MAFAWWLRGLLLCFLMPSLILPDAFAQQASVQPGRSDHREASKPHPTDVTALQHIVFIVKENRSFDNYFGTFPGANGATTATISTGQVVPLGHTPDVTPRDIGHDWTSAHTAIDNGKMDKFDLIKTMEPTFACNVNGDYLCLTQYQQADLPNYWAYAKYFALADNMFSSIASESFPNHLYTVAASSGGVISNPPYPGCDSPPWVTALVIDSQGVISSEYPCFTFPTLADSLQAAGVSWMYYADEESIWNPLDAFSSIRDTSLWQTNIGTSEQFIQQAAAGTLPAVSWVVTKGEYMEHPPNSVCNGENWTVGLLNTLMQGPDWSSTAVFLAWDDFGGLYDHVPAPPLDEWGLGPRVPLIMVSPYVIPGYISHTQYEFSSFLKLVEDRYNLAPLTERDQDANDMLDAFDFTQDPLNPLILQPRDCSPLSTTALNFVPQLVAEPSPPLTVTVNNFGTTGLAISSTEITGADYSQTSTCPGTLAGGKSCTISVTFTPVTSGVRTGTLTVTDSDPSGSQTVALSGTGTNVTLSPALLNFGAYAVGMSSAPKTATLTNHGTTTLKIVTPQVSGDYRLSSICPRNLAAGASCNVGAKFTPTTTGTRYGSLTIANSDGSSPQVLNLTGVGTEVSVVPGKLVFASQPVGTSSLPQIVTFTNIGTTNLTVNDVSVLGTLSQIIQYDFSQTNNCVGTLAAGASCTVSVTFTPVTTGSIAGSLSIAHDDADSPKLVTLSGTGSSDQARSQQPRGTGRAKN